MDQQLFEVFDKPKKRMSSLMRMDALMELENLQQRQTQESEPQDQMNLDTPQESQASAQFNAPNQKFRVSQKFGNYNPGLYAGRTKGSRHYGADIATPKGTQVYAPISGEVIPGEDRTFGKYVRVLGDDGIVYQFSHLSNAIKGGRVQAGQPIAQTGNSGRSTGAHLDIMAKKGNNYIDPLTLQNIQKLWL
jgi:murein DD-endopeptidase MepM/ murein hydrolase activator NlpD